MEEKVKEIVSRYVKLPAEQIQPDTVIDRSAMTSSILLHRMYASLAAAGVVVENYGDITTFGGLMKRLGGKVVQPDSGTVNPGKVYTNQTLQEVESSSIGLDIEEISLLPPANDYREDEFYTMNFSPVEIAYCILQPSPRASFAGLFAAKEAIVKADNSYLNTSFNNIVIEHLPNGKPTHPQFSISISHTTDTAAAVAVRYPVANVAFPSAPSLATFNPTVVYLIALTSLALSLAAIFMLFYFKG